MGEDSVKSDGGEVIVWQFARKKDERVVLAVRRWRELWLLQIRVDVLNCMGEWWPKHMVALRPEQARALAAAIPRAVAILCAKLPAPVADARTGEAE